MSHQLIKQLPVPPNAAGSMADGWSGVAAALSRFGRSVWRALEASGAARAERELRLLAAHHPAESELGERYRSAARHLGQPQR